MLQRLILPLVVAVLSFSACRHDVDVQPPPPPTVTPTATPTFGISGDTAIEVMQARSVNATFFLSDSGAGLPVNLSVSGLPAGVTAGTGSRVTPPGQAVLRISAGPFVGIPGTPGAPVGTFIATVLAKMDNGTEKTHSIRVTVVENPNCVELRTGTYKKYGCSGGWFPVYVTVDAAAPDTRIQLSNFPSDNRGTYAEVNCANNTLVIPRQNIGLLNFFSATGTFSRDTITGTGIVDHTGIIDTCSFIMVR